LHTAARNLASARGRQHRRSLFYFTLLFVLLWPVVGWNERAAAQTATQITTARVWPSPDYTRITLETQAPVAYTVTGVKNPERLVLDLEGAWTVEPGKFRSRARNTPFGGFAGTGAPVMTIVGGKVVTA